MSLDYKTVLECVRDLDGLAFYPRSVRAQNNMISTLMECCVSVEHVRATLAEFQYKFPIPGEVRSQAARLRDRFEVKKPVCAECQGSGWAIVMRQNGDTGAKRCACWPAAAKPESPATVKPAQTPIELPGAKTKTQVAEGKTAMEKLREKLK